MNKILIIATCFILVGCFSAKVASDNRISVPAKTEWKFKVDGKPLNDLTALAGNYYKAESVSKKKSEVTLESQDYQDIVKWFVIFGGIVSVIGLAVIFILKKVVEGLSGLGLGISIILGALTIKALIQLLSWVAFAAVVTAFIWGAYTIYRHRKQITPKAALNAIKDISDDGKINGSTETKDNA